MTAHEIYLQRAHSTFDSIRKTAQGLTYLPNQFGGIHGQQALREASTVLEITEFEISWALLATSTHKWPMT